MKLQLHPRFLLLLTVLLSASGCTEGGPPLLPLPDAQIPMNDGGGVPSECQPGLIDCGDYCANVAADSENCGSCHNACPTGLSCAVGRCDCAAPLLACDGVCTDTSMDPANCGACGNACGAGEFCTDGACVLNCNEPNLRCESPDGKGPDVCTNVQADPMNCGGCGTQCSGGAICNDGRCTCPSGQVNCSGVCTDVSSDQNNCGACLNSCGADGVCMGGSCTSCGTDLEACGSPARCVDTDTSTLHCGACGNVCGPGESCGEGACICLPGFTNCDGTCVNLDADSRNCGGCGIDCGPGGVCTDGVCGCAAGTTMCGPECAVLDSSRNHCGECGFACGAGENCRGGGCVLINDSCETATVITSDLVIPGENTAEGGMPPSSTSCGFGTGNQALFYAVTVPAGQRLDVTTRRGSASDLVLFELEECGRTECTRQTDFTEALALNNIEGTGDLTRVIGVRGYSTSSGGTFDITFTYTAAGSAPNAECTTATVITTDTTITGESTGNGGPRPTGSNCGSGTGSTALYYEVTIAPGDEVHVQTTPSGDIVLFEQLACGDADCSRYTGSSPEQLTLSNLVGTTPMTRIIGVRAQSSTATIIPTFDIDFTYTTPVVPTNADCDAATPITADTTIMGEDTRYGGPRPEGESCGNGAGDRALYYEVTVPAGEEVVVQTSPSGDIVLFEQLACGDLDCVRSTDSNPERLMLSNAFGTTAMTRIVGVRPYGTPTTAPTFGIAFAYSTPTMLAPNADCNAATVVTANATFTGENTDLGGPRPGGAQCGGGAGERALYYAVTVPAGDQVLVQTTPSGDILLFEQDACGDLDCIRSTDSSPEQLTLSNAFGTADVTRIVGVRAYGRPSTPPTFGIAFTYSTPTLATNADCNAATPITADTSIMNEDLDAGGPRASGSDCGGGSGDKALYYAVTIPPGQEVLAITDSSRDLVVFEPTACGDTTCVRSSDSPEQLTFSNLDGTTDVTRIFGVRAWSSSASGTSLYDVEFIYRVPATNASCTTATPITETTTFTGENTEEGGPRPDGSNCGGGTSNKALYYAVTVPAGGSVVVTTTARAGADTVLFSQAMCGDADCLDSEDVISGSETLTLTNSGSSDLIRIIGVRGWGPPGSTFPGGLFDITFTYP